MRRTSDTAKAEKDRQQAATLLAVLVEHDDMSLTKTMADLPSALLTSARRQLPALRRWRAPHPQALEEVERSLRAVSRR